jgi:hypothetical protein
LQRAEAGGLDVLDVNLVFAARLVHADRSAHDQLQAVLGLEFQPHRLRSKADTAHLRLLVLQSEIQMAGLRRAVVRNLALNPQIGKLRRENVADARGQFGNAPDLAFRREVQFELPYFFSH